ncbi:hypothetical protein AAAC51_32440 [Priestia megaterium]
MQSDADTAVGNFECFNEYRTWHLAYMKKVFAKGLPAVRHISTHKELHLTPSASNKLFKKIFLFSIAFLLMKIYMLVKICYSLKKVSTARVKR